MHLYVDSIATCVIERYLDYPPRHPSRTKSHGQPFNLFLLIWIVVITSLVCQLFKKMNKKINEEKLSQFTGLCYSQTALNFCECVASRHSDFRNYRSWPEFKSKTLSQVNTLDSSNLLFQLAFSYTLQGPLE